jgi:AcrR family transcriptional regulator/DNA-binding MarR family transcriptional regulator
LTDTQLRSAQGSPTLDDAPTGAGPLGSEQVSDIQRARILSGMVEVAAGDGYLGAAVARVIARAGVSRRTFYELFQGREDCFLAAFDWGTARARELVVEACGSQRSWRDQVRHGLAALLAFLDAEPELARVCVIEALGAGKLVLERRARILEELTGVLDGHAPKARGGPAPLITAEGVIGGAFSVLHGRLLEQRHAESSGSDAAPLMVLHGQLMALIALPYLGPRTAGEELVRSAPELPPREVADPSEKDTARSRRAEGGRLLERLDMRLTYRTVRCLLYIGEHPGCSNREITQGADISDEGQASKLLKRLERVGLVANSKPRRPGYANYWTLTPHGEQVLSVARGR